MARNNGSTGTIDFAAVAADMQARAARLKEMGKEKAKLDKERDDLNARQSRLDAEIASLTGNSGQPVARPRKAREDGDKPQRRGARGGRRGVPLHSVLLSVMPGPDADPVTKDEIAALVEKSGYKTSASSPKVVIGQTLGKYRDFQNVARGKWRLSKHGVAARDKMNAAAEEAKASETPKTDAAPAKADEPAAQPVAGANA